MTMEQTPPITNSKQPSVNLESLLTTPNEADSLSDKDARRIIDFVKEQFQQAKNERFQLERQWSVNLAFYFGKQNIQLQTINNNMSRSFRMYTPPVPYYRSRPVINRIRPLMRTEMSKLTSQKPTAYIVPATSDTQDIFAASAGEQIWDSLSREKKLQQKFRRAIFWTSMTGNGFIKDWWDDNAIDSYNETMGDICYEVITPFHLFFPDLDAVDIEDQPFVIQAANRRREQLEIMYGKELKISKQGESLLDEGFSQAMGVSNNNKSNKDDVLVLEGWVKPGASKLFPEGGMVSIVGDSITQFYRGLPYNHQEYPFTHLRHVETGKFYGESAVTDLISPQREFNRTRGQIIEAKNRMAKPQLAAEQGSIDTNKLTSEPGQVILYRPGFQAPQPIPLVPLPSYVLDELERIKDDMNEISGQHEVSRGQVPPGVTAATAISYLQEQDESKLSYTYDSIEEANEKIARHSMSHVVQYWDIPRMVKVAGQDGSFDVMTFAGQDLRGNTDIRTESGSALPTSRAAKQAFILDLMKMGFIDPNKGLEVMEIGGINKIYESIQIDVRQAQRENLRIAQVTAELLQQHQEEQTQKWLQQPETQMKIQQNLIMQDPNGGFLDMSQAEAQLDSGLPEQQVLENAKVQFPLIVPVNTWDDNRIHIERHNQYRKSQAFDNLSQEAKDLFEQHVNAHVHAIMVGAQGAMQVPPEAMALADNPETVKEVDYQNGGSGAEEASMPPPPQQQ